MYSRLRDNLLQYFCPLPILSILSCFRIHWFVKILSLPVTHNIFSQLENLRENIYTYIGLCNLRGKLVDSYFIPRTSNVYVIRVSSRKTRVARMCLLKIPRAIVIRHLYRSFLQLVVSIHDGKCEKRTRIRVYLRVTKIWKSNARIDFVKNLSSNSPAEKKSMKLQRQNWTEGKIS